MDEHKKIDAVGNGTYRCGVASAAREAIADVTSWCEQLLIKMRHLSELHEKDYKALRTENAQLAAKLQISSSTFAWPLDACAPSRGHFQEIVCSGQNKDDPSTAFLEKHRDSEDKQFQCIADEESVSLSVGRGFFVARFQPPLVTRAEEAAQLSQSAALAEEIGMKHPFLQEEPDGCDNEPKLVGEDDETLVLGCGSPIQTPARSSNRCARPVRFRDGSNPRFAELASSGCVLGDTRCGELDAIGEESTDSRWSKDLSVERNRSEKVSLLTQNSRISLATRPSQKSVNFKLEEDEADDMMDEETSTIRGCSTFCRSDASEINHHMVRFKVCEDFGKLSTSTVSGFGGHIEQERTMHKLSETHEDFNFNPSDFEETPSSASEPKQAIAWLMLLRRPSSPIRIIWECLGVLFLVYDSVTIPMQAFDIPEVGFLQMLAWVILWYWTLDVFLSFLVGYYKDDTLVLDLREVGRRYIRSWFPLDCVIIGVDWGSILANLIAGGGLSMDGGSKNLGVMRAGKVLRVLRLMRLLRIMKLTQSSFLIILQERFESERLYVMSNLMKNVLVVLAVNHLTACTWYWIGTLPPDGKTCWVRHYEIDKKSWLFAYLTSVHWSLAQFANGEILIEPQSIPERLFCIFVLVMSIIIFSAFLAIVGNTVSQLIQASARRRRDHFILRLYLRQQDISLDLKMRANRYVGVMLCRSSDRVNHQDVKLFEMLSRPLQNELLTELYLRHLRAHPFFSMMATRSQTIVRNLCCQAVRQVLLSRGDILFSVGEEGKEMYFVHVGTLYYNPHQAAGSSAKLARIDAGDWFCEAVLWIDKWLTCGRMAARTECELVAMDARKFREVVKGHHTTTHRLPRDYANAFVESLNTCQEKEKLTDYQMDLVESREVASVLDWWRNRRNQSTRVYRKLEFMQPVPIYNSESGAGYAETVS